IKMRKALGDVVRVAARLLSRAVEYVGLHAHANLHTDRLPSVVLKPAAPTQCSPRVVKRAKQPLRASPILIWKSSLNARACATAKSPHRASPSCHSPAAA